MSLRKQTKHDRGQATPRIRDKRTLQTRTVQMGSLTPIAPSFFEVSSRRRAFGVDASVTAIDCTSLPYEFGNYTLGEVVGEGGAGIVFKGIPKPEHAAAQGFDVVAVKLIRPEIINNVKAAQRFEKESRVHAGIKSAYVTQHLEFGCEEGHHFIASEFVQGIGLNNVIDQLKPLTVGEAFRVAADILKALVVLHSNGVVHRDVKPSNVIASFKSKSNVGDPTFDDFVIAKLTDFGLARHIEQSESLAITRQRTILGTPHYMAPEQYVESCSVDGRADIYSVGVTLYQMLAGQLPFDTGEMGKLAELHRTERPNPLTPRIAGISEAVNNIVMKALEKEPSQRYQNASEMLADVQCVLDDQPISLRLYPETPNASHSSVRGYDFQWNLNATAKQLWPLVSDTDRFNQAMGLPAVEFTFDHSGSQRKVFAKANFNGMKVRWREHPFQWIIQNQMSVLREFEVGPFEWVTSTVELHPLAGGQTRLIHRFLVKPRGLLGKLMTPIQFNLMTKRSLNQTYSKLERIANDTSCAYACDAPFSKPVKLSRAQRNALDSRVQQLAVSIPNGPLVKDFAKLIGTVADSFAARMRPIPLSQRLECSLETAIQICLRGVEVGLLNMSWDVICPVCRIAAGNAPALSRFKDHEHCKVCDLDFEVDFNKSVEVIFSVHPEIRPIELKTYCIGGPFHAPHVLAQNRLLANQFVDVGTTLSRGKYKICGPQLVDQPVVKVHDEATKSRAEYVVGASSPQMSDLKPGAGCIHIENKAETEVIVRLEQAAGGDDSVTAAMASQLPLFQKLFPQDVVTCKELTDLSNVYLLGIKLLDVNRLIDDLGEMRVRQYMILLQKHFEMAAADCRLIECTHDSILVSFNLIGTLMD